MDARRKRPRRASPTTARPAHALHTWRSHVLLRLALITATIALAAACGSDNPVPPAAPSPAPAPAPAPSPAPAPGQTVAAVSIPTNAATLGNRAFNPAELNVTAGTTVTWTNTDTVTHTSSSDAQGWDSAPSLRAVSSRSRFQRQGRSLSLRDSSGDGRKGRRPLTFMSTHAFINRLFRRTQWPVTPRCRAEGVSHVVEP